MRRPQQLLVKAAVVLVLWAAMSHALPTSSTTTPDSRISALLNRLVRSASDYRVVKNVAKARKDIAKQVSALDRLCSRPTMMVVDVRQQLQEYSEIRDKFLFPSRLAVPKCGPCVDAIGKKKICSPVKQKDKQYIIESKVDEFAATDFYFRLPVSVHRKCRCEDAVRSVSTPQEV